MIAKIMKASKPMKLSERMKRQYSSDVRKFKKWCNDNNISYRTFNQADSYDICVLSKSEYEIRDERSQITQDNESYFLNPYDYEKWCEEA